MYDDEKFNAAIRALKIAILEEKIELKGLKAKEITSLAGGDAHYESEFDTSREKETIQTKRICTRRYAKTKDALTLGLSNE
ncbi:MAG: hypothetical protein AB8B83_07505 [Bdellovibrionales bacterium]